MRLPSLIAGTLVIPALYELGRELFDRRTGLIAAAFVTVSPLLIWYAQEARMYAFVTLFGVLALLTQVRVMRSPTVGNWALYILATSALLWSHYFGLLLIGVQQVVFIYLILQRRRAGEADRALMVGFAYSAAVLVLQLIPLLAFAAGQYDSTSGAAGSPAGTYDSLSFYAVVANMAWALWGYHSDGITELLAALWPLFLLLSLLLLGRGGSRQTIVLAAAALVPIVLLFFVALFDRELFEVRYFLVTIPLLFLLVARLVTGWLRSQRGRAIAVSVVMATLLIGLLDQQLSDDNPRLFDFRGAIEAIEADAGPRSVVIYEPPDMRYVLEYYAPELRRQPLARSNPRRIRGTPVFVLASFQDNKAFFARTNKFIGQLDFFRRKVKTRQDARRRGWTSSDEHPPVGRPAAQGHLEPGAEVGQRAHAGADHHRAGDPGGALVLHLDSQPGPDRRPGPLRDPDRGRAVQLQPGHRVLVDLREREGAQAQGAQRVAGGGRLRARSTRSRRRSWT